MVYFNRNSEGAFGSESATRGGSFWTRIRWGKAVAAPGVRGQDGVSRQDSEAAFARNERKAFLLLGIQRERLAAKVQPGEAKAQPGEARFGPELDGEKQVVGGRMRDKNGRKLLFFSRDSKAAFARNERNTFFSRDSEGAFGSESATRGGSFWTRIRWGKAVAAPGVSGQDAREKWKKTFFS